MAKTPKPVRKAMGKLTANAKENGRNAAKADLGKPNKGQNRPDDKLVKKATNTKTGKSAIEGSNKLNEAHMRARAKTMGKESKDPKVANLGAAAVKETKGWRKK